MESAKPTIAFFITSLRAGGGTRVIVDLANWFAAEGYPVDLLTLSPSGRYREQLSSKVRLVDLTSKRLILALFPTIKYFRSTPPSVVVATDEISHLLALGARQLSGADVRIVLRVGNMFSILYETYTGFRNHTFIPWLSKLLYPNADAIIAVSAGVRQDLLKLFRLDPTKVHVIFSPKKLDEIARAAAESVTHPWLLNKDYPVLVTSCRLRVQKDLPTLLRAFTTLQQKVQSRLLILGEGQELASLQELSRDLGISELVDFVGYVDNPHAYIAKSDLFVTTSQWEGLSNSLVEALTCGIPVVATDCDSGPREVLAPETDQLFRCIKGVEYASHGVLVPVKGVEELTEALAALLTDDTLRARYTEASRERARAFDADGILEKYRSVLLP